MFVVRIFVLFSYFAVSLCYSQSQEDEKYHLATIAFYNSENLFDIYDDTATNDEEFLPTGAKGWTAERYSAKLEKLSQVISILGDEDGPEILGLCEIENRKVVEDLISTDKLVKSGYGIVHHESPDLRGIDVAMIYKTKYFTPIQTWAVSVRDTAEPKFLTRDILFVTGALSNDTITFAINHWPSRRSPEPLKRILAGMAARTIVDSLLRINPNTKIILMGDFNDNPNDKSISKYLNAKRKAKLTDSSLYNPMAELFIDGYGSIAYQDTWSLFDQMIMTQPLLTNPNEKYYYRENSASVFNPPWLVQKEGRYTGYPFRNFSGNNWQNAYSDHFPVFIYLIQKVKKNE